MRNLLKVMLFGIPLLSVLLACGPARESQALGSTSVKSGMQRTEITASGQTREVLYHVPSNRDASPAIVLMLHGGGGAASKFLDRNPEIVTQADREGFLLMVPDAGENWNDGRVNFLSEPSDVPYIRSVIDFAVSELGGDRSRVFITGPSNGGAMAYKIACDAPEIVTAIAPIIASFNTTQYANCNPSESTPVAIFNGTEDPLTVYNGGEATSRLARFAPQEDTMVPTPDTAAFWARVNGCASTPTSEDLPDRIKDDGTTVTVIRYSCPRDQVILYRINGGGHSIAGSSENSRVMERLVGKTSQEIDAIAQAIAFFKTYGL